MTIDEELIRRWQRGWSAARGLPEAEEVPGGLRIRCDQPSRQVEVLALRADQEPESVTRLAQAVAAEELVTWLTVPTLRHDAAELAVKAAGLAVLYRDESLMTTDLAAHPRHSPAAHYRSEVLTEGRVTTVMLCAPSGETAARGTVAVVGSDAVADRIETMADHRRRGLGSALMSALAEAAVAQGARTGILIASVEGRHLYNSLGWQHRADVLIAHRGEPESER